MIADPSPGGFYVYLLADPRSGKPFYAGKGQRYRAWQHEADVRARRPGYNRRKIEIIQAIIDAGLNVEVQIVAVYDLESHALDHEFRLIDASPSLTNVVPGGGGVGLSQRESDRRAKARVLRLRRIRERERREAALEDMQSRRNRFLAQASDAAEREEILAWLNAAQGDEAKRLLAPRLVSAERREAVEAQRQQAVAPRNTVKNKRFGRRARGLAEINPADYLIG